MRKRPSNVGVYALLIRVPRREIIRIGHLGSLEFPTGVYVYIGSALNSLHGRVSRHLRKTKRKHWHIDYLLDGRGVRLADVGVLSTGVRLECRMSQEVQIKSLSSVSGFGCSDCRCDSHLHRFATLDSASTVLSRIGFVNWSMNMPQP